MFYNIFVSDFEVAMIVFGQIILFDLELDFFFQFATFFLFELSFVMY